MWELGAGFGGGSRHTPGPGSDVLSSAADAGGRWAVTSLGTRCLWCVHSSQPGHSLFTVSLPRGRCPAPATDTPGMSPPEVKQPISWEW